MQSSICTVISLQKRACNKLTTSQWSTQNSEEPLAPLSSLVCFSDGFGFNSYRCNQYWK